MRKLEGIKVLGTDHFRSELLSLVGENARTSVALSLAKFKPQNKMIGKDTFFGQVKKGLVVKNFLL